MHSIFQISISRNTKCAEMVGFPKDGHIILCYTHEQSILMECSPKAYCKNYLIKNKACYENNFILLVI